MFKVLVVDDDHGLRTSVTSALSDKNYQVDQATNGEEAINKVTAGSYNLVLLDVNMPKMNGIEALREIKTFDPSIICIMLTAFSNIKDAVEATKLGAYNYLEKPITAENLVYLLDKALRAKSMVESMSYSAPRIKLSDGTDFVGQSTQMKEIFSVIEKLSAVDTPVLIRGQSGTGKELVAKALHYNGPRKDERFVSVNCSAIPENLIESEFFGHEKGAFTGADSRKIGKFQYADSGTLFLDEIGDISPAMQVKLLRVLQEKKFMPVGSNREIEVNVRIVAATNRDLEKMIERGEFREDLFYRLNVLPIHLPPLVERKNDLDALMSYFIDKFNKEYNKSIRTIHPDALTALKNHPWPGNIRELENVIEHAFVLETSTQITLSALPETFRVQFENGNQASSNPQVREMEQSQGSQTPIKGNSGAQISLEKGELEVAPGVPGFRLNIDKLDFQANKEEFEKHFLLSALKAFKGRINQTALHANIPKKTLLRKLEKYGISAKDFTE